MKDDRLYLIHISECIARIEKYTLDGHDAFFSDEKTQDAVLRNLQVLAASTQLVHDSIKAAYPEVEWQSISAFRNVGPLKTAHEKNSSNIGRHRPPDRQPLLQALQAYRIR